ncbi:nucleoside phosphorylase domain-containing protein [Myxozyma melibiosi]|uniref:Purine nucleoside phosphorylase n=1 Tax=Myxozyma melibiosi TaxID=54550 RepID=A0ABR1FAE1_9ASCO
MSISDRAAATIAEINRLVPVELQSPKVAVICGSGLQHLADALSPSPRVEINFADLPNFPQTTVEGHTGKLVFGLFGNVPSVCMVGRVHFYEGISFDLTTYPARVFSVMGVETLIVTNASGGLNPDYKVGDLMVLNDHINFPGLAGSHPLKGPNDSTFGPRFQPLSDAYDHALRIKLFETAKTLNLSRAIHEGVYVFVSGPTYETRAESRMLRMFGGDCVGMSTVPEIIVARHSGMRVLAISLITNAVVMTPTPKASDGAADLAEGIANHAEVIEAARLAGNDLQLLVLEVIKATYQ